MTVGPYRVAFAVMVPGIMDDVFIQDGSFMVAYSMWDCDNNFPTIHTVSASPNSVNTKHNSPQKQGTLPTKLHPLAFKGRPVLGVDGNTECGPQVRNWEQMCSPSYY